MHSFLNNQFVRPLVWCGILCASIATLAVVLVYLPRNYPEQTLKLERAATSFIEQITLPLKLAKLSVQEPDTRLLMPVHGVRLAQVGDTWGAARGADRSHEGQDIFAPKGTPVFSATNGYVRRIRHGTTLGGTVVYVTGAGGRRYYYAHFDRIADGLREGQEVTTDTVLGFVGNTGNAATTPAHLHFGVYQSREAIDPLPMLADR